MTERRTWYHTIDLPDGTSTPGYYDTRSAPQHVPWPVEVEGGHCLDVGTFDGFWAFELERRGAATVVALDVDDPGDLDWPFDLRRSGPASIREWGSERGPGFHVAAEALGSCARRVARSVYDLEPRADGEFDVVLCGALLLHLRDPIGALERMRSVCRGALVLVEAIDPLLELTARRVAAARLRPSPDQWWRANSLGLVEMVRTAGFAVREVGRPFAIGFGEGAPEGAKIRHRFLAPLASRQARRNCMPYRALVAEPRPPHDAP